MITDYLFVALIVSIAYCYNHLQIVFHDSKIPEYPFLSLSALKNPSSLFVLPQSIFFSEFHLLAPFAKMQGKGYVSLIKCCVDISKSH